MRHASMAMSWVAEAKAMAAAASTAANGACGASLNASARQPSVSSGWATTIQPRRRPKRANGAGGGRWSSTGAHRNFTVYASPT